MDGSKFTTETTDIEKYSVERRTAWTEVFM